MNGSISRPPRPSSEQVRDLHVYVIPPELWRQRLRSAANEVITDSISLGFLRVSPHVYLHELRQEIVQQLEDDYLPKDYAFLKSVGRCLTQVKARQERELKAKHFLPPYAYAPELYILDSHAENMRDSPSTISHPSAAGSVPRTGSRFGGKNHPNDRGAHSDHSSHKYPSSTHETTHGYSSLPEDNFYGSQIFDSANDQPLMKSGYPSYGQPYSHDISALTNAHRNQIDRPLVDYTNQDQQRRGNETYRKQNDDSSGYRSMPSPRKYPESPVQVKMGDNSMSRKLNQGTFDQNDVYHQKTGRYSPLQSQSYSPTKDNRTNAASKSPDKPYEETQTFVKDRHDVLDSESPDLRQQGYDDAARLNQAEGEGEANSLTFEKYGVDKSSNERDMLSATPNASLAARNPKEENVDEQNQYVLKKSKSSDGNQGDEEFQSISNEGRISEEKERLLRELRIAKNERLASEKKREDLVKKARAMQAKTNNRRNQAREVWKKKYYEAKKSTPGLEIDCQKVRAELDGIHKKYLAALENQRKDEKQKDNHQLEAARLQYDVDELQRKADAAKMKLTAEMKLRNQAETELRALRAELTQKKMNMNLSRAQKMNEINNSALASNI